MKINKKSIRNLTIGAVTGGLIVGGAVFALNDRKPFIRDYINAYKVNTDSTIRTTEGLNKLNTSSQFLTFDEIEEMNKLEVKSYTPSKDGYDVDLYGFTNGSLTDEEITTKQNQFVNGNSLLSISDYDNYDDYQVETRELPASYENILEEINIKTVNYASVIKVRESRESNIEDTSFWTIIIAAGAVVGASCATIIDYAIKDLKKIKKLK